MKKNIFFMLIAFCSLIFAETKTFIRDYTYNAGHADSKVTSRTIALEQVKRILLEEIGVYLQSEMTISKEEKNDVYNELTKQEIQSIISGITETKIIEENWDDEKFYIKVSIIVDPEELNKNIERIGHNKSKLKGLVDVKVKTDDALAEIERLNKELATTTEQIDQLKDKITTTAKNEQLEKQKKYINSVNILSSADWFDKAYNSKNIEDKIFNYEKAIEINPEFAEAYNYLGNAYSDIGDKPKQIEVYKKAAKLGDKEIQEWLKNNGYSL